MPDGVVPLKLGRWRRNTMKQIIIRMFVALIMCAVTSVIRFTTFIVISPTLQVHAESIWILRLILASVLSPLLYNFLDKRTSNWAIRAKHKPDGARQSVNLTS